MQIHKPLEVGDITAAGEVLAVNGDKVTVKCGECGQGREVGAYSARAAHTASCRACVARARRGTSRPIAAEKVTSDRLARVAYEALDNDRKKLADAIAASRKRNYDGFQPFTSTELDRIFMEAVEMATITPEAEVLAELQMQTRPRFRINTMQAYTQYASPKSLHI